MLPRPSLKPRNERIIALRKQGYWPFEIRDILATDYPELTREAVKGVCLRAGLTTTRSEAQNAPAVKDACRRAGWNSPKVSGEQHHQAKLTEAQVRWIRDNYKPGCCEYGQFAMARTLKVGVSTVEAVITRKTWKHL